MNNSSNNNRSYNMWKNRTRFIQIFAQKFTHKKTDKRL